PTLLVLGDQLSRTHGPLARLAPDEARILMVESRALLRGLPHHAQKVTAVLSAMRHLAHDLQRDGFEVTYRRLDHPDADDFAAALAAHLREVGGEAWWTTPRDDGVDAELRAGAAAAGAPVRTFPDEGWIVPNDVWDAWAEGRTTLKMETFYRHVRRWSGVLMDDAGEPVGGRWNYDAANRAGPPRDATPPAAPTHPPDAITRDVQDDVRAHLPDAWGALDPFGWPVTRDAALATLDAFLDARFARFGHYQDAMVVGERTLWHSTLSVPLNLGLLHPREVVDAALAHAARVGTGPPDGEEGADATPDGAIPLNALEGFVRQILGWREFLHHVYRTRSDALRGANVLEAHAPVPPAFWGAPTDLHCLATTIRGLEATGYAHHIERLMVTGNVAQLVGVDPAALLDWFTATHVDALDWVMVPNVLGMSQYADGGGLTTKPYAAGANYLHKQSDACAACRFDPKKREGDDACPLTAWYWAFVDRHEDRFASNHRMRMIVAAWRKRDPDARRALLDRADATRTAFLDGEL
ncbi:MAG: cryptochrome/photolyase family protein, partial [Trueperaceae bacterium]|nr:cryptochrome/photolyase family protein [Trueperaceae bacterium]